MEQVKIQIYTKLNKKEEINDFLAIKDNDVIKYIDLEDNKMIIDMKNNVLVRENEDYLFNFDFNRNIIEITLKKLRKSFNKEICTMTSKYTKKSYLVRYKLLDEQEVNEYYVKF